MATARAGGKATSGVPEVFKDREVETSILEAIEIGSKVLRKHHRKLDSIDRKGRVDLVTEADREAERRVLDYLRKRHPDHTMVGEESWDPATPSPSGFAWAVDPLDGTTNYAHGLDHYGISIGLLLDGVPVAGAVGDVSRGHVYRACRGRGAFRDRTRLHVSENRRLVDSLVATGFPYDRKERVVELMATMGMFLSKVQGMRRFGVASLDLALVAAGQFDAYYESPLKVWDVAAGVLLVLEAGGRVTDLEGGRPDLFHPSILASNGAIHAAMLTVLRETRAGLSTLAQA